MAQEVMDNELFELCKKVYEITKWELDKEGLYLADWWWTLNGKRQLFPVQRYKLMPDQVICPLYTSDYLLEKLPPLIKEVYWLQLNPLDAKVSSWEANYFRYSDDKEALPLNNADTPLKSLLKLTISLHEAGEIK